MCFPTSTKTATPFQLSLRWWKIVQQPDRKKKKKKKKTGRGWYKLTTRPKNGFVDSWEKEKITWISSMSNIIDLASVNLYCENEGKPGFVWWWKSLPKSLQSTPSLRNCSELWPLIVVLSWLPLIWLHNITYRPHSNLNLYRTSVLKKGLTPSLSLPFLFPPPLFPHLPPIESSLASPSFVSKRLQRLTLWDATQDTQWWWSIKEGA